MKFAEVVNNLKTERKINREDLGKFSIVTSTSIIYGASDLQKIAHDKKAYSPAFAYYNNPYEYLLKLKEIGVEEASIYRFFIKLKNVSGKCNKTPFQMTKQKNEGNLYHRQNL
jgi:hypothetical protein